nr:MULTISPECIES: ATP-binding protein [unclassified Mesorhizobium]
MTPLVQAHLQSVGEWGSVFGDSVVAIAILDRLLSSDSDHHPR